MSFAQVKSALLLGSFTFAATYGELSSAAMKCERVMRMPSRFATHFLPFTPEKATPALTKWRQKITQKAPNGKMVQTSKHREELMEDMTPFLENFILNWRGEYGLGDIPPMQFYPEAGVQFSFINKSVGLDNRITQFRVSGLGKKGVLRGTILLPVSGHQGNALAREWAVTDTYSLLTDINLSHRAAGKFDWKPTSAESVLMTKIKSLGMVTAQEVEIQLNREPGQTTLLLYDRAGSDGPGGYIEGRIIEFVWDGT